MECDFDDLEQFLGKKEDKAKSGSGKSHSGSGLDADKIPPKPTAPPPPPPPRQVGGRGIRGNGVMGTSALNAVSGVTASASQLNQMSGSVIGNGFLAASAISATAIMPGAISSAPITVNIGSGLDDFFEDEFNPTEGTENNRRPRISMETFIEIVQENMPNYAECRYIAGGDLHRVVNELHSELNINLPKLDSYANLGSYQSETYLYIVGELVKDRGYVLDKNRKEERSVTASEILQERNSRNNEASRRSYGMSGYERILAEDEDLETYTPKNKPAVGSIAVDSKTGLTSVYDGTKWSQIK